MKVLVACEESQEVCKAFRELGHITFSCDVQDCSGGHDEWHIKDDVLKILNGGKFTTVNGIKYEINKWDLIIAFPPCTDLAVSGARHFEQKRNDGRQLASIEFFMKFLNANCDKIAVENPIGIISGDYVLKWYPYLALKYGLPIKPTQIIQPFMFGEPVKKSTCLWLKGLPSLKPTQIVKPNITTYIYANGKVTSYSDYMVKGFKSKDRQKHRSKTFPGIAKAMAEQWG